MLNSIKKFKSLGLDPNTIIYPGHYDKTTLAYELMYNMYL